MIKEHEIRILSVDAHPLFREAVRAVIKSQPDLQLVAEAASGAEAFQQFREHHPHVTLMDIRLPDSNGIEAMIAIRGLCPEALVILVSTYEDDVEAGSALLAGAAGRILKTMHPREMVSTIREVYAGRKWVSPSTTNRAAETADDEDLTSREVEALPQVAGGNRVREIARRLFCHRKRGQNGRASRRGWLRSYPIVNPLHTSSNLQSYLSAGFAPAGRLAK